MSRTISGKTVVAGVVGAPVAHSLSPLIQNAWLQAAGIDGVYVAFAPPQGGFEAFVEGLRGGAIRGLNVTLPFKERALARAGAVSDRARAAGAANLLIFEADGTIGADITDGQGLLEAFEAQAPGFDPKAGPAVIFGAGGAARAAAAAFSAAGAQVRIVNRTVSKAEALAKALGGDIRAYGPARSGTALEGANAVVNATSASFSGGPALEIPLGAAPRTSVVMDMTYKPLETPLLKRARAAGHRTVDGLEMLIRQAAPSFQAFYGAPPPPGLDVRGLVMAALGAAG